MNEYATAKIAEKMINLVAETMFRTVLIERAERFTATKLVLIYANCQPIGARLMNDLYLAHKHTMSQLCTLIECTFCVFMALKKRGF